MAHKTGARHHVRVIGTPPHEGRRYVSAGKVRIEWTEEGRRRQRTVGPDTAARRAEGDEMLARLLESHAEPERGPPRPSDRDLPSHLRAVVVAALDLADYVADRIRRAIGEDEP